MAVTQATLFRVVQIFHGDVVADLVMRQRRPVILGSHAGCDLVAPLPDGVDELELFSPVSSDRYGLNIPSGKARRLLQGDVTRAGGSVSSLEDAAGEGERALLEPGDWALFHLATAPETQILCQYIRLPLSSVTPGRIASMVLQDQEWTAVAAVLIVTFLLLGFLHKPHGTQFESTKLSRRFSTLFKAEKMRANRRSERDRKRKRKAVVIKETRALVRRTTRISRGSERVQLPRQTVRARRINKGGLLALNRAMRRSGAVNQLFRKQESLFADVEKGLSGLSGPGGSGGGSGDGVEDPYATRGGTGAGGSVGRTDGGKGPRLGGPIRDRGMLSGRRDRKVRVARVGLGGGSVSGTGLSRSQIFRVVRARRGFIKWCYESALKRAPAMGGGKVTVQFKINPQGRVVGARAVSVTLKGGGSVASCITRAVRRWRFPQSQGYSVVRFPFLFSSGLK